MAANTNLPTTPRGSGIKTPTTLDNRFKLSGLTYPADLLSDNNPYGSNYVVFYINVHQDSFLTKQAGAAFVDVGRQSNRGELANVSGTAIKTVATGAAVVTAVGADITNRVSGLVGADAQPGVAKVADGLIGLGLGVAVVTNVGEAQAQYKTQQKAIALYMPGDVSIKYGTRWEEASLAGTTAMAMALESAPKGMEAGGLAGQNVGESTGIPGAGFVGKMVGSVVGLAKGAAGSVGVLRDYGSGFALGLPGPGEALSKSTGTAANPKKEQLFKEVEYRTFTFSYQFHPRSQKEADDVKSIIEQFKLHMHPEFRTGTNQFLYIYPSEFDIYYYHKDKENLNIHRHTSCVLTDMTVSYAPQGVFNSFEGGRPVQTNITLTFKELALLTKENITDGY